MNDLQNDGFDKDYDFYNEVIVDEEPSNPQRGALILVAMVLDGLCKKRKLNDEQIDKICTRMQNVFDDIEVQEAKELHQLLQDLR